jgi:xylitol oxidase
MTLGTRPCFNEIADSPENLVSLNFSDKILDLDREHQTVTVDASVRYGDRANASKSAFG